MANYKYTPEGLPIVTKKLADSHISEINKITKPHELGALLSKWQIQIGEEQPILANYIASLSNCVCTSKNETELIRLISYQYGFSDIFYLLRRGSDKPLPQLSRPWLFPSLTEILGDIEVFNNQKLLDNILKENPYLIYYHGKKYKNELNSKNTLKKENVIYAGEGFFKGYSILKDEVQNNKNSLN